MSNKTINQALKDLYLGLGGDPSALTDNSTVSDYIEDLESAIKGAASGELPEVTADDIGDVLAVVSDGASGAEWGKGEIPSELPSVEAADIGDVLTVVSDGESGAEWAKGAIPSELPTVSASDNGKLLGVDNGVWNAIAQDTIIIKGTRENNAFTFPNGMNCIDIVNLIEANKNVILYCTDNTYKAVLHFAGKYTAASHQMYAFMGMRKTGSSTYIVDDVFFMSEDLPSATWNTKTLSLS